MRTSDSSLETADRLHLPDEKLLFSKKQPCPKDGVFLLQGVGCREQGAELVRDAR